MFFWLYDKEDIENIIYYMYFYYFIIKLDYSLVIILDIGIFKL